MEFTVYNANVNLFCAVTLMLESNGLGKQGWQRWVRWLQGGGVLLPSKLLRPGAKPTCWVRGC